MERTIKFVDLGLPSGTLWAITNKGAQEVYACGEIIGKPESKENLPTYEQCKELIERCDFYVTHVMDKKGLGHTCVQVKGCNGESLFFPCSPDVDEAGDGLAVSVWCKENIFNDSWSHFMLFQLSHIVLNFYELSNITIGATNNGTLKMVRYVKCKE